MFGLIVEAEKLETNKAWQVWATGTLRFRGPGGGEGGKGGGWGVFKGGDSQLAHVVKEAREGKMVFLVGRQ